MENFVLSSELTDKVSAKLLEIQKATLTVAKDANNPFFKSRYADLNSHLEGLLPELNRVGLTISQVLAGSFLVTIIMDPESNQFLRSYYPILVQGKTPQEIGSQVTYARRYSLSAMFNMQAVDDDGNLASGKQPQTTVSTQTPAKPVSLPVRKV